MKNSKLGLILVSMGKFRICLECDFIEDISTSVMRHPSAHTHNTFFLVTADQFL